MFRRLSRGKGCFLGTGLVAPSVKIQGIEGEPGVQAWTRRARVCNDEQQQQSSWLLHRGRWELERKKACGAQASRAPDGFVL